MSDNEKRETFAEVMQKIRDSGFGELASHIEAAHGREVAQLREALEAIISGYEKADLCDMNYGEWCHDPANACANASLCKAIHEAKAALAATETKGAES